MTRSHKIPSGIASPAQPAAVRFVTESSQTPPASSDGVGAFCGWTIYSDENGTGVCIEHSNGDARRVPYGTRLRSLDMNIVVEEG